MAEYIDRDKLRELLLNIEKDLIKENGYYDIFTKGFGDCVWQVENFPAADVVEIKHGYWINEPPYRTIDGRYLKAQVCSSCDAYFVSDANKPYSNHPYCSECGAKMDGEYNEK